MQGRRSQERSGQYPGGEFALRHGLSEKSAKVIFNLYGPSRPACDAAAMAQRKAGRLMNLLTID